MSVLQGRSCRQSTPCYTLAAAGAFVQQSQREAFTGVLLAFAVPYSAKQDEAASPSHRLENVLHMPIAFLILPVFALANTGIVIGAGWAEEVLSANSLGILLGLVIGKPGGILLSSFVAVTLGICCLPFDLAWRHVVGAGLLGGIGFTMSIFVTNPAYTEHTDVITS